MMPDEWTRLKRLVTGALALRERDRPAYLSEHCSDDATRAEAESLLRAIADSTDSFDSPVLLIDGRPCALDAFASMPTSSGGFPLHESSVYARAAGDFCGTPRYAVRRRIGAGGMGVVYEVEDRDRQQIVALKTLRRWNGSDIYQLKREFRALAGIAHPNLISLHDLVVDEDQCFFTMELVEGQTFVDYVRAGGFPDPGRARRCLAQLIDGIEELHRHGQLHRDVKPSNVLVTGEERLVILDFGLTAGVATDDRTGPEELAGTPAYMSPERWRGATITTASDWYSVGATLFHALTGRAPFDGSMPEVLDRPTVEDSPPPASIASGIPDDLNDVCLGFLRRRVPERLTGLAALNRLAFREEQRPAAAHVTEPVFVGRTREVEALSTAFAEVCAGRSMAVYVHGPSGIGKTALMRHFLEGCLRGRSVLTLRGRCHEHESVPYKGLDGVIDALSRHLAALPTAEAAVLMPRDGRALARLFPVLQIDALAAVPALEREPEDPVALRRNAFAALRELLGRLAMRQPVVVEIDDFHWADADSAASISALLRAPDPPPVLLIVAFRTEEIDAKPFLRALVDQVTPDSHVVLPIAPMSGDEVAQLLGRLLPAGRDGRDVHVEIATEARGNPYLIEELARYLPRVTGARQRATLDDMLTARMAALSPAARVFLDTLAVCGRPIMAARICEACGLGGDERPLVARLRAAHFVRTSRTPEHVEMYHDRIRETLAAALAPEVVRRIHAGMAAILRAHGDDDPEALFEHCRGAGEWSVAAGHAAAAAARATHVLAFDRAATLYRDALNLDPDSPERPLWHVGLARALENAGRPAESADAYLVAADVTTGLQRLEWQRKAAEQLLMGGHIDRGLDIIRHMLPAVGLQLARDPRTAAASMLLRRGRLAIRGLGFDERRESEVSRDDLLRIDTCWAVSTGLMLVDTVRAAAFHAGHLRMALNLGEPYRIARALALEASFAAAGGGEAGIRRSNAFALRAEAAAERNHHPHLVALSSVTAGIAAFVVGDWATATEFCERALTILREQCTGVVWELTLAQNFFLGALMYRGQIRRVAHVLPRLREDARARGNLYFETEISTRMGLAWLAMDDPDTCERYAREAMSRWSDSGFHRQHYNHLIARIQFALYRGEAEDAWMLLSAHLPAVRRHLWLHVHFMRVEVAFVRARCALAMAVRGRDASRMLAIAAQSARLLERERTPWTTPLSLLVRAALAWTAGDRGGAAARLDEAIEAFDRADMRLYAAAARRRLASVTNGDRRSQLIRESDTYMRVEEIRNPIAMTRLLAPGFPDEELCSSP